MEIKSLTDLFEISKEKLEGQSGVITISFANRQHIYSGNDVIGNCLQEWLPEWFRYLGVDITRGSGSQKFPDFIAEFEETKFDVEIKAWNINNAPAFDLANFGSFIDVTFADPHKFDAYYFVLGYRPADDGFSQGFVLEKVFLKRLWELTAPARKRPIGLQVKRGAPYALRPANFYKTPDRTFKTKDEFIQATFDTFKLYQNKIDVDFSPDEWLLRVSERESHTL